MKNESEIPLTVAAKLIMVMAVLGFFFCLGM